MFDGSICLDFLLEEPHTPNNLLAERSRSDYQHFPSRSGFISFLHAFIHSSPSYDDNADFRDLGGESAAGME